MESYEDSFDSSMMRELLKQEVIAENHRRRNIRTLDDRNQERPDVLATEFQEIEIICFQRYNM
jgi:hypothetical protein